MWNNVYMIIIIIFYLFTLINLIFNLIFDWNIIIKKRYKNK